MTENEIIKKLYAESKNLTLLYVEDDLSLCEHTKVILEDFFSDIVIRNDGASAWEIYQEKSFDIVLTDIVMPKMDGRKMAHLIREKNKDQVIVVMSAYEESDYFIELLNIGISSFVPKPPSSKQLFSALLAAVTKINNA